MTITIPVWVFVVFFFFTSSLHHMVKMRRFPELSRKRVLLQSVGVGSVITGFSMLIW